MTIMPIAQSLWVASILTCISIKTDAQNTMGDSSYYVAALNNTIIQYHHTLKDQSVIYTGRQYVPYFFPIREGDPYFQTKQFRDGSLVYDGIYYNNVQLTYDELAGILIILGKFGRIELLSEKVSEFTIADNRFIRLVKDDVNKLPTGFYQLLYAGKTSLLKRNQKTLREELENVDGVIRYVDQHLLYYYKKNGLFYAIKSKKDALHFFQDRKKDIQQYISKNSLDLRSNRENTLLKIAEYYDQLTK
jgi:hypothetical protein